ncbi:MAG TPA: 6-phosphofructokinase, partial [Rubrobacteraceae bacterium]|nr:6-phosphofructokinase [Rubrobacteraceae bacterium]
MKIAVLTGGGVAPGMNAAVRAVAQKAFSFGWEVLGVEDSYDGLLEGRLSPIDRNRLGGLVHRGGTFLGTGRSKEVREPEGQERVVERLSEAGAEGIVVIGGGGSLTSARALGEAGIRAVGIPATIDNDVPGTELAIG